MGSNGIIYKMNFVFKFFASYVPSITTFPTLRKVFVRRLRISFDVRCSIENVRKMGHVNDVFFFLLTPFGKFGNRRLISYEMPLYHSITMIDVLSSVLNTFTVALKLRCEYMHTLFIYMYCVVPWFIS